MGVALKAATLPLRRRLIGTLLMLAGVLCVALGFFTDLRRGALPDLGRLSPGAVERLPVPFGTGTTPANILQHAVQHGLVAGSRVERLGDVALRGGVIAMAAAAALAAVLLVLPWLRGLAGLAAGIGLLGVALVAGTIAGTDAQLRLASGGLDLAVHLGPAVWLCGAGFVVILVGGALAALRPLAGLLSGISLALAGAGMGVVVAFLVGGERVLVAVTGLLHL